MSRFISEEDYFDTIERTEDSLPLCSLCFGKPNISYNVGYSIYCSNCYDGAPDSSIRGMVGIGLTLEQAVDNWKEIVEFYKEAR